MTTVTLGGDLAIPGQGAGIASYAERFGTGIDGILR